MTAMFHDFDPVDNEPRVLLEIRTSRSGEETPEAMVQFLSSLVNVKKRVGMFLKFGYPISLEVAVVDQRIRFYLSVPIAYQNFIESQLISQYPKALIMKADDYMPSLISKAGAISLGQMKSGYGSLYPIKIFRDFKDVDTMSSLLAILSKSQFGDSASVQFLLEPISNSWQKKGAAAAGKKTMDASGKPQGNVYSAVISEKVAINGFKVAIRIATTSATKEQSDHFMDEIANSFSAFNNPSANFLVFKRPLLWQKKRLLNAIVNRSKFFMPSGQIFNVAELATMYHFPGVGVANIANLSWHKVILSDPPELLPVANGLSPEELKDINFFAWTDYKNKQTNFGIKKIDRRRHIYIIGKTGAGKSTLIANMAINDMNNGRGFCIIDPHGDLCETVLRYVPENRINDVVYLDPSDQMHSFSINPMEVKNPSQSELVVSGLIGIFRKLYDFSWGPRLEYILRNTLLTLINYPDATFMMVPDILNNPNFRKKVMETLTDPVLRNFWINEFNTMQERQKNEALAPILNKVGQFLSAKAIRNIIQEPKSSVDFEDIMNNGKILLLNLSQGKLGEDNAALLGAMSITKMQMAAMQRVNIPEEKRVDFYLYVDEFQNFATSSFVKILAEARKYRLDLLLANQYIAQVPEDVRSAIFGNVGTMLSFLIGAEDTPIIAKEFSERFQEADLLALGNHRAIIKLAIDGVTTSPFLCQTLPLPPSTVDNRERVLEESLKRYTRLVVPDRVEIEVVPMPNAEESGSYSQEAQSYSRPKPSYGDTQERPYQEKSSYAPKKYDRNDGYEQKTFVNRDQPFQDQRSSQSSNEPKIDYKSTLKKASIENDIKKEHMTSPENVEAAQHPIKGSLDQKPQTNTQEKKPQFTSAPDLKIHQSFTKPESSQEQRTNHQPHRDVAKQEKMAHQPVEHLYVPPVKLSIQTPGILDRGEGQDVFDSRHHKTETHGTQSHPVGSSHESHRISEDGKKSYKPGFKKNFKPHTPQASSIKPQE